MISHNPGRERPGASDAFSHCRNLLRFTAIPALILGLAGCETIAPVAPPSSTVTRGSARKVASTIVAGGSHRISGMGHGDSMAPLYGENTRLVIAPIDFEKLEKGMIVAYRDYQGHRVVHKLAFKQGKSWVAVGLNNDAYDRERVTPENLLGVVYAVINSAPRDAKFINEEDK